MYDLLNVFCFCWTRDQVDQVDGAISPLKQVPGQGLELEVLQALLDGLVLQYNAKNSAVKNSINPNNTGKSQ